MKNRITCVCLPVVVAWFSIEESGDRVNAIFNAEIYEQKKRVFLIHLIFLTLDGMEHEEKTVEEKYI